jgi:hypothetical protein
MPKLPKGMFKRGQSYYVRVRVDGRDVWRSLGAEYGAASRKLTEMRRGGTLVGDRTTVVEAAKRAAVSPRCNRSSATRASRPRSGMLRSQMRA